MPETHIPQTRHHFMEAEGVRVFYRESGPADAPVVLLLHGFPTSSFQYRELIPRLADVFRVIASDLPGFGFTGLISRSDRESQLPDLSITRPFGFASAS